jgi:tRNA threonylcarbamoyl adenosine modification protein (Sua5/YciO/YrdC/YwlC family)
MFSPTFVPAGPAPALPLPAGVEAGFGLPKWRRKRRSENASMAQFFEVHPDNPQGRLLKQAGQILHGGGIVAIPTDSSYALVCHLDDKGAAERLRQLRQVDEKHHLTLLCRDLSELASYARVDNRQYRLLKHATPGPYTFILEATKEVPRRVSHPSRRTIGLRVPDHRVTQELLALFGQPLLATTLIGPGEEEPMNDPVEIRARFEKQIQAVVDAGACPMEPTTVVDLTHDEPVLVRLGRGDPATLGLGSTE